MTLLGRFNLWRRIFYGRIPELAGVALDAYRKAGAWQWRVEKE